MHKTKIIFVIGGLFSGIGKGILTASLARLFKNNGQKVSVQKHDPYLNVDARFLNPLEHGEVFVTEDGLECDQDLGTYERFLNQTMTRNSSSTLGKIYYEVIKQERNNFYEGRTNDYENIFKQIELHIERLCETEKADLLIVEIGGNITDENISPYLKTAFNMQKKYGKENIAFVFLSYLTFFNNTGEYKTRSVQHSLKILSSYNIEPDFILLRSFGIPPTDIFTKITDYSHLKPSQIKVFPDFKNIYEAPLFLEKTGILEHLGKQFGWKINVQNQSWKKFISKYNAAQNSKKTIKIAIVNKYQHFELSYVSLFNSFIFAAIELNLKLEYTEINPENFETKKTSLQKLSDYDGILIPGGYGQRGFEGKILASQYAREKKIPFFGICFGMQAAAIGFARTKLNLKNAQSQEFFPEKTTGYDFVINYRDCDEKTMYIGTRKINLVPGSLAANCYQKFSEPFTIQERHRHRFNFNPKHRSIFQNSIFKPSGITADQDEVVSILEIADHPFYIGVQFHPELKSRPENPHPLFSAFFQKCWENKKNKKDL